MSKCRSLLQENQDLGKQISQGRVAQLEAEIALHKKHCLELKETYEGREREGERERESEGGREGEKERVDRASSTV